MPLTDLVKLILHALDNLPHYEIFVHKHKEEALEECVEAEESESGHGHENLCNELAEKLSFVQYMLIQLG